jgi:predicted PurR-regulated permease PerM
MQTLSTDFMNLIRNHWKTIFLLVLTFYFLYSWPDIKQGILDGWAGK